MITNYLASIFNRVSADMFAAFANSPPLIIGQNQLSFSYPQSLEQPWMASPVSCMEYCLSNQVAQVPLYVRRGKLRERNGKRSDIFKAILHSSPLCHIWSISVFFRYNQHSSISTYYRQLGLYQETKGPLDSFALPKIKGNRSFFQKRPQNCWWSHNYCDTF